MTRESPSDRYGGALRRGAFVNVLGVVARLLQPLYLFVITWLWGPALVGPYLLGGALLEIVSGTIVAGYADATTIFGSRYADDADRNSGDRRALYRTFANTFSITAALSLLVFGLALLFARPLVVRVFPGYRDLLPGIYFLAASLLPRAVGQIAISATKATMRMEDDAFLNGFAQPFAMLVGCFCTRAAGGGLTALFALHFLVETAICLLAISAFGRCFSLSDLAVSLRQFSFDRALLGFSIPQSLNLTFNRYIARLDGIMLAAFGLSRSDLGYFATAALLTSNLSQIRLVFSGALGPVVARHHMHGERRELMDTLGTVCRWTTSLVVPAILASIVLRTDVLHLVSPEYGRNSLFVVILLIPPFTNAAFGMAGACLMFTGHSRVTLANSFAVALLNTLLTYFLIPKYGMVGAATATAAATSATTALQMIELDRFEGVRISWRAVQKPLIGLAVASVVLYFVWDPADLALFWRLVTAFGLVAGYGILMLLLGHEDLVGFVRGRPAGPPFERAEPRKPAD